MTVSWLMLERYALGELTPSERADVERKLAESSEDRACLDAILGDDTVLPPLPVRRDRRWPWLGALAVAATIGLALLPRGAQRSDVGVKGGEVAITLISERTGVAAHSFREGERFKLMLTCPPSLSSRVSVEMLQDGQRYTPLPEAPDFTCGNLVPWPGAFTLDGQADVEVCVSWGSDDECTHLTRE